MALAQRENAAPDRRFLTGVIAGGDSDVVRGLLAPVVAAHNLVMGVPIAKGGRSRWEDRSSRPPMSLTWWRAMTELRFAGRSPESPVRRCWTSRRRVALSRAQSRGPVESRTVVTWRSSRQRTDSGSCGICMSFPKVSRTDRYPIQLENDTHGSEHHVPT